MFVVNISVQLNPNLAERTVGDIKPWATAKTCCLEMIIYVRALVARLNLVVQRTNEADSASMLILFVPAWKFKFNVNTSKSVFVCVGVIEMTGGGRPACGKLLSQMLAPNERLFRAL